MVRHSHLRLLAALPLLGLACNAPPRLDPAATRSTTRPINDGTLETGQPGVVYLLNYWAGVGCTGTIIGHRLVLTAKHCIQDDNGSRFPIQGWQVGVGPNDNSITHTYTVSEVRTTPGTSIDDCDVALMLLNETVQETPYRYQLTLDRNTFVGSDVLLIGYGQDGCPTGNSGRKLKTVDQVTGWVSTNDFYTEGNGANHGDSGGPVFNPSTMEVIGVISRGGDCTDYPGLTIAVRVAAWMDLVNQALTDTGDCGPTSLEETCGDGIDNNCDGRVDEGCATVGTLCTGDEDCASRYCRDVGAGNGPICTLPCDYTGDGFECGSGAMCKLVNCSEGACAPGSGGPLAVGSACQQDSDCASLLCVDPGTGTRTCLTPCRVEAGHCLGNEACAPLTTGATCGGCAPDDQVPGPRLLGERCDTPTDCASGQCFDDGGLSYCVKPCDTSDECPELFHCRDARCVRGSIGEVGSPCVSTEDCDVDLACYGATADIPGYCTSSCLNAEPCPEGTTCDGVACALGGLPLGAACESSTDCATHGCFSWGGENACTEPCDRVSGCPNLTVCTVADNGVESCQPDRLPVTQPQVPHPKHKGCATGGAGGVAWLAWLTLGLAWLRRRRAHTR